MHPMITCKEFEAFIIDYLEGELPFAKRTLFRAHLFICKECRIYLRSYESARQLGKAVFEDEDAIPDSVPEDLITAVVSSMRAEEDPPT